jgi:predicted Zn-ribbon and HTH transcriptional regulator
VPSNSAGRRATPPAGVPTRSSSSDPVSATLFTGDETLEVVGESHYQEALWEAVGGIRVDPVREDCVALLVPEPNNPYDPNAVRVVVEGKTVGYLSRENAALYLPGLRRLMANCHGGLVALRGVIVGGGPRENHRVGFLGVFLDHDPADFGLALHHIGSGKLRTGLSEAISTDVSDDSYDLSWLRTLSADDDKAIGQLNALLQTETEPISRHYVFGELESRLYHARLVDQSALVEFDETCSLHHQEIDAIREALVAKFQVVPLIEMYQHAVIRCQKEKHWSDAYMWAERGLAVYGDQPARPEFVDDLRKRAQHAQAKLEQASRPKTRAPRNVRATSPHALIIETLVCASCGNSFERERTRGRKPRLCPACRGEIATATSS